jgi:hypothetical protein
MKKNLLKAIKQEDWFLCRIIINQIYLIDLSIKNKINASSESQDCNGNIKI